MATVYLAQSRGTGGFERFVAIKLTHPHLEGVEGDFMADLLEEAKLAVRIRHPNIVPTLDVGESGKSLFLVMDYVEGDSLSGLIRRARKAGRELPLGMTMRILCDALAGLHAAHELKDDDGRGLEVVHRDVSPQNILVGTDGMARLADFGIARASSRISQTRPGAVKGKVAYMPPEQVQGGALDRRCDVWAAGVIAWELLARRRLFDQADDFAVALQLVMDPLPEMRSVNPNVPPALELVIKQALHKEKMARTPSAAAFRAGLIEACKSSGITLFEHDEVGAIVEELTRASLNERMRQAKAILAGRKPLLVGAPNSQPGHFGLVPGGIPVKVQFGGSHSADLPPLVIASIGLFGAAAVFGGAAIGTGITGLSARDEAVLRIDQGAIDDTTKDLVSEAESLKVATNVLWTLSALSAVGGGVVLLLSFDETAEAPPPAKVTVGPRGLFLTGSF